MEKAFKVPEVAKKTYKFNVHDLEIQDDYFWLRERDNEEVLDYLKSENNYTKLKLESTETLQKELYEEMVSRIKETDISVPVKKGDYFYYSRTEKGKQYAIYARKHFSTEADEEILIDSNQLAEGEAYFDLGVFEISPNHNYLAYSVDLKGDEEYTLYIKDLEKGCLLADQIKNTATCCEWANDNKTFFYSTLDESKRPYKLFKHVLGEPVESDKELFEEKDERFFLSLDKSKDGAFLLLGLDSKITSEAWFLDADNPTADFSLIQKREEKHEYSVEHHKGEFYVLSNDQAQNFKLMKTLVVTPEKENWSEVIAHKEGVQLEDIDVFEDVLVVFKREGGLDHIELRYWNSEEVFEIPFEEPVYALRQGNNPEFKAPMLRFSYTSLTTPNTVIEFNFKNKTKTVRKQQDVLGGYDPQDYQSERIYATASDGTKVPISLVYKKSLKKEEGNPFYLYGYGSYGINIDATFSSNRLSLLNRGFVFGIAHIRGGSDLGRDWYENGKFLTKKNTFTDFIACSEHVIQEGYTSSNQLYVAGGSAGGLLMGACVNERPDLFQGVIMHVPFVDVINTMLDESLPLTVTEYDEWGNPNEKQYFDYIYSYSPYDQIKQQDYPSMFVTGGLNDPRVQYWEPTKWVAKLREFKTDQNDLLLKIDMGSGHGGASGRYEYLKEIAMEYAFILNNLKSEV